MKFGFSVFQSPLAVQHSLLKVGRFLEQLELGTNLTESPLNKTDIHKINFNAGILLLKSEQIENR